MKLSENEGKVLQELIKNSRTTDTEVSTRIGISTTGVGKIRKKLEATGVIRRYLPHISLEKMGFNSMLMVILKIEDAEEGLALFDSPNLITAIRLCTSERTHLALYAFRSPMHANQFLHSLKRENYGSLEIVETHIFSPTNLVKPLSLSLMLEGPEECDLVSKLKG
ncbi:MAG: Lrp/AsnC family transcriptional regulator [Methermicoccaceae archaeon]